MAVSTVTPIFPTSARTLWAAQAPSLVGPPTKSPEEPKSRLRMSKVSNQIRNVQFVIQHRIGCLRSLSDRPATRVSLSFSDVRLPRTLIMRTVTLSLSHTRINQIISPHCYCQNRESLDSREPSSYDLCFALYQHNYSYLLLDALQKMIIINGVALRSLYNVPIGDVCVS